METMGTKDTTTWTPSLEKAVTVEYTNWKGETAKRKITPVEIFWGSTEWHKEDQWLMKVWDFDRNDFRTYAMTGIKQWWAN